MEVDKGPLDLAKALKLLQEEGLILTASFVGPGPAENLLRNFINQQRLENQVSVLGKKEEAEVAEIMRKHKILVVPSIWKEPFGIVALEGMASGCFIIGTEAGGLKEAIGNCGLLYPNGDFVQLAKLIKEVISHPYKYQNAF
ncbi:glycosyltransferase family 4 protein [Methylacidiphilum caldifontis]|uniref:glycosyltransferase family 4 protein n=1 Tax=Methylacidiphilum caldifontis TaxID=2795386 RepID=UPI001A8EB5ED|nr:glycosyltransferase family 4 protein [Methylacidiphilum caldifontis]QSR88588.1 glycosyltransferase family 4 protein [Methylacidiphilum caldifontis]